MTTRNITTTTRRIVLALGVATAAAVALPSMQAAHAASIGAHKAPLATPKLGMISHAGGHTLQGWSGHAHTPSSIWTGHTPQGWSGHGHTPRARGIGHTLQGYKYGTPPVSFRVDGKPQGWSF
jgi:hypothetical protein